ncbi:hypothetical protein [Streptomyces sp. RKAG293]|uniref:hypothetical protein n=1 Tax=Streptomyces sp. RKAG293 TaxID=2893403 RepID=UPI0020338579|nr:hypothetical protein [Streptomyces sp. RKAG293]MCM2416697.1 hypothetical protein [Streptomyces sp. RKAG293]
MAPDLLLVQAEADLWQPGAAATALARPAAWQSPDALDTWATIAAAITANAPEQLAPWVYLVSLGAAVHDSGTATRMGQILTVAVIEGEADSALELIGASAEAAMVRGIPAASWMAAVRSELGGAVVAGHLVGVTVDDVERFLERLVQEPDRS